MISDTSSNFLGMPSGRLVSKSNSPLKPTISAIFSANSPIEALRYVSARIPRPEYENPGLGQMLLTWADCCLQMIDEQGSIPPPDLRKRMLNQLDRSSWLQGSDTRHTLRRVESALYRLSA